MESTSMSAVRTKESTVDVLIIGAGPAGLMAANALNRAGVSVRIIDKRSKKVDVGQADGIQPRTLEVFKSYGLVEPLIEDGNQVFFSTFYNPSGPDGGIQRTQRALKPKLHAKKLTQRARYSFSITLHQGRIEDILIESMSKAGLEVGRSLVPMSMDLNDELEGLESNDSYPIKVTLRSIGTDAAESETEVVRAKYVLGSDGAHSWVRKTLGINMDGEQSSYVWGVIDTVPETDFPDIRNRCIIHSLGGSMMVIPREDDIVRLYTQLSDEEAREVLNVNGRVDMTKWGPEQLLEICKAQLKPYDISFPHEISWWALYIVGQRVASSYSKDERVFIAGDACHTHSPKAGQGMNASMNDSHNLAWKLAYVIRGWADRSILKTYEFERRKYAQDLIDFDRKWSKLFSGKPRTEQHKEGVSPDEMLKAYETFSGFTSGTGIHYAPSAITNPELQSCASELIVGTRMPPQVVVRAADARPFDLQDLVPSDTRFKILIFSGDLNDKARLSALNSFVARATAEDGFLQVYGRRSASGDREFWSDVFDVSTVIIGRKDDVEYTIVPEILRPHWSKVFIDDVDPAGADGGDAYESLGISPEGAIIIIRPDGYVGMVAPINGHEHISKYFAGFLKPSPVAKAL